MPDRSLTVAVLSSASPRAAAALKDAALALGRALAEAGHSVVCGGAASGPLGVAIGAAQAAGGQVVGVVTASMVSQGLVHCGLTTVVESYTVLSRTAAILSRADAVVALPGGMGTLQEVTAAAALVARGATSFPVVLWDIGGGFTDLHRYYATLAEKGLAPLPSPFVLVQPTVSAERLVETMGREFARRSA